MEKFKSFLIRKKKPVIFSVLGIAVFIICNALISSGTLGRQGAGLLVPICINIMLAVSLNLIVGFLGELSLGHAGFMSVGAYAGCLFTIHFDLPVYIEFPLALIIGGLVAAIFGVIIGLPALRLNGDYLAIVTLAFGEIIRSIINSLEFTGGAGGLKGINKFSNFSVAYIAAMLTIIVIVNLVHSRHGRAITAIRDNIISAEAMGINVVFYKLISFVMAAFFAGAAGVLYGHHLAILKPGTFDFNKSIEILVIVVLGGMGNITGSIIAAIIITILPEVLRDLSDYRMLIYSIALIVMMLSSSSPKLAELRSKIKGRLRPSTGKEVA
ncbi:MAG: branched-chain amino acid ABC transporter permease [Firmicutes bacterium]|nr:branched-chain amino acid ABC transporter permease [Bacillota bacterium]